MPFKQMLLEDLWSEACVREAAGTPEFSLRVHSGSNPGSVPDSGFLWQVRQLCVRGSPGK